MSKRHVYKHSFNYLIKRIQEKLITTMEHFKPLSEEEWKNFHWHYSVPPIGFFYSDDATITVNTENEK